MATLKQATQPINMQKWEYMDRRPEPVHPIAPPTPSYSQVSTMLVSPLPPVVVYPDTLRQFYRDGMPQYRAVPPQSILTGVRS